MQFVSATLDTGSLDQAFQFTFNQFPQGNGIPAVVSTTYGVLTQLTWTLTLFVVLYLPRPLTARLLAYGESLVPLSSDGDALVKRVFSGLYRVRPVLIVLVPLTLTSVQYLQTQALHTVGLVSNVYLIFSNTLVTLLFSAFIWLYFRGLWALYKLGKEPLSLKSVETDVMFGLRPIGSISFTLFLSYFCVIGLSVVGVYISPDPISVSALFILSILGGAMFFLPLNSFHKRMVLEKRNEERKLYQRLSSVSQGAETGGESEVALLKSLREVQLLQIHKDRLSKAPTWPFDTGVFGRFAAIILSITAILLSKIIAVFLHI